MADENEAAEVTNDSNEGEGEVGFAAKDADLAAIFQDASDSSEIPPRGEENREETTPPAETPAEEPPVEDPRIADLLQKFESQNEKLIELQTRNTILEHQVREKGQTATAPPAQKGLPSRDEFKTKAAANPIDAIYDALEGIAQQTDSKYKEAVSEATTRASRDASIQRDFEADRGTALAEYGELFDGNKEFSALAGQIYAKMTSDDPTYPNGMKWHKGAMYAAAATAHSQMVKAGKLGGNPKVIKLQERKPAPQKPILGSTSADAPRTAAANFSAQELAVQKRVAESMGISLDRYHKIYADMKKRDPSFGG